MLPKLSPPLVEAATPLCSVLSKVLSSSLSTLTRAFTYSESAEALECNEGWLSNICMTRSGSLL
uniref:Uncharacterized protein n=1 Tax=Arundo donax TaxID=35708 RepID=A0A0A9FJ81_ARUDO